MKQLLAILSLAVVLAAPAAAGEGPRTLTPDVLVASFADRSRPGLLQAGIRWGEIQVEGHDSGEVHIESQIEVEASIAARLTDREIRERVAVRLDQRGDRIDVVVDSDLSGFYAVNLTIRVPRGTALGLEVRDGGNITVDDVGGEVEISNRNGSVELSGLTGAAVVHARNGSIRAAFDTISRDLPVSFSTLNGSVDVTFPDTPSANVRIRYNRGGVESDFPIVGDDGTVDVDATPPDGRATRLLLGQIGGGGPQYYFHTANGTVYLRRAQTGSGV